MSTYRNRDWTPNANQRDEEHEESLIHEARAGSKQAQGALLTVYHRRMTCYFARRLPRELRAKLGELDLTQDACLLALDELPQLRDESIGTWRKWLFTICRHLLAAVIRRYRIDGTHSVRREERLTEEALESGHQRPWRRRQASADEVAIAAETEDDLEERLANLPADERQIFVWHRVDGLTFVEIADRLGLSIDAVKRGYRRAEQSLNRPKPR